MYISLLVLDYWLPLVAGSIMGVIQVISNIVDFKIDEDSAILRWSLICLKLGI